MSADKMGSIAYDLLQDLTALGEDQKRTGVFVRAFERLEARLLPYGELFTRQDGRELRVEMKEMDQRFQEKMETMDRCFSLEFEKVRKEHKESESRLVREILRLH